MGKLMKHRKDLNQILKKIDGRSYKAYNDIKGKYDFDFFILHIDHVQRDPFAGPSLLRVELNKNTQFPQDIIETKDQRIVVSDFIARVFAGSIIKNGKIKGGSGKSGVINIDSGRQEILERSCVNIFKEKVEIRFSMGLPARGRRIMGVEASRLLFEVLPILVQESCFYKNLDALKLKKEVELYEDVTFIRKELKELDLVAFVRDGSILPRESGVSEKPMKNAVFFKSPESLSVTINTPNNGPVTGMGIPVGVTLIVGGGYHGKSTLLQAVERGVYNHIYGDGREWVVTDPTAVKIRAEDGRRIENVDISSFILNPPMSKNTVEFRSENASGSTSQAANIIEALETGTQLLLFDEDTSATNFMIRDERMQRLVSKAKEPITPFIDRVRELYKEYNTSTVIVMGGSGDYFEVADTVVMMDNYRPENATEAAMNIKNELPINRMQEVESKFGFKNRYPISESIKPYKGRKIKLDVRGKHTILIGTENIDLSQVEQLMDSSQTRAIAYAIYHASQFYMDNRSIREIMEMLELDINENGLDILAPKGRKYPNNLAKPRIFEFGAALNRLRTFKTKPMKQ
jgi:predicted ABC-class ATPase